MKIFDFIQSWKIDKVFAVNLKLCSKCQIGSEDFVNVAFLENTNFMIKMLLPKVFRLVVGGEVGLSTEEVVACKIVEHLKKT